MIALFTDFGWRGPYVGQMHAVFARDERNPAVIDLMHDAPRCNPRAASHLLAALAGHVPAGTVFVAVVDPGVGTERRGLVVQADGHWFVGPDNGLFDVVSARASEVHWWCIEQPPERDYATFHGRDLFAPVAAAIARGEPVPGRPVEPGCGPDAAADLAEVIYIDEFGNACTGLRAAAGERLVLFVGDTALPAVRTFADVESGEPMRLVNSLGLVEIACNADSAAARFDLDIGTPVVCRHTARTGESTT